MTTAELLVRSYLRRGKDPLTLADTIEDPVLRNELRTAIGKVIEEIGGPVS